jgi:hypothetical protein
MLSRKGVEGKNLRFFVAALLRMTGVRASELHDVGFPQIPYLPQLTFVREKGLAPLSQRERGRG